MKKRNEKRQWQKPELIVLVRSKPEEAVLGWCKAWSWSGPGMGKCTPECKLNLNT
jgi:hypothetical protein